MAARIAALPDMRFLITGVNGFVGPWLVRHLREHVAAAQIFGMAWGEAGREELTEINLLDGDLTVPDSLPPVLATARPDVVFHLAAASSVASSWQRPAQALEINAIGQVHLLEAIHGLGISPLTVIASSAEVYGRLDGAAEESLPLMPISPYGVSKATQELIAHQYADSYGLPVIRLRLFNLIGPGQAAGFAASSFARQVAEIEKGLSAPCIRVGNLAAKRDFTDVRDAVRAFYLAATRGRPGDTYNLCSGRAVAIRELLDQLLAMARRPITEEVDPQRLRPADIPVLLGSNRRLSEATGWQPELQLRQTLRDLLDWWRARV
jgi:GDP-4-dehydro-6-deoxy-D-mannose reductase